MMLGKVNCHKHGLGVGAKIDRFSGERGFRSQSRQSHFGSSHFSPIWLAGGEFVVVCWFLLCFFRIPTQVVLSRDARRWTFPGMVSSGGPKPLSQRWF